MCKTLEIVGFWRKCGRPQAAVYRSNAISSAVCQTSSGSRLAAQGFCAHSMGPSSSPGMLCHGSTQMKRIGFCGVDQISVYGKPETSQMTLRPVSFSSYRRQLLWLRRRRNIAAPPAAAMVSSTA